jgi:hypothetical protein
MITLKVTPLQYDIIKAAVTAYSGGLMQALEPKGVVSTATVSAPVESAPYGLRKDGTPAKRRGRKSTRKVRA